MPFLERQERWIVRDVQFEDNMTLKVNIERWHVIIPKQL